MRKFFFIENLDQTTPTTRTCPCSKTWGGFQSGTGKAAELLNLINYFKIRFRFKRNLFQSKIEFHNKEILYFSGVNLYVCHICHMRLKVKKDTKTYDPKRWGNNQTWLNKSTSQSFFFFCWLAKCWLPYRGSTRQLKMWPPL